MISILINNSTIKMSQNEKVVVISEFLNDISIINNY
jgi:hypothetical protein